MAGVRLHHPMLASCTLVVELPTPYPKPYDCPACKKVHERKSIHLRLDAGGHVIVSPEVFASLETVFLAGMEVANEVPKPPPQVLGAVELPKQQVVDYRLNGHKDVQFYVPGRTKYESRDRLHESFRRVLGFKEEKNG